MNQSRDSFEDAFMKNLISVGLGIIITYINSMFVFVFLKTPIFYNNPRYILYIHLVLNDIIMLFVSITLHVIAYTVQIVNVIVCFILLFFVSTTSVNTTLNLAGMSLERYIAICKPLHHSQLCTVIRTYTVLGLIWLFTTLSALTNIIITLVQQPANFFMTSTMCYNENIYGSNAHTIKSIFIQTLYLSSVWITLFFTYAKVFQAANAAATDTVKAKKAQKTILLHGIQLLLCMLSFVIPFITSYFLKLFPKYRSTILFTAYLMSNVIPTLLTPLIYGLRDRKMLEYVILYLTFRQFGTQAGPAGKKSTVKKVAKVNCTN